MKHLLILALAVVVSCTTEAQQSHKSNNKINWITMQEALKLQKKKPKKIIVDVYTTWCGPCKLLDKNTFQNKDVADYINKHFYAVKFNAEGNDVIRYENKKFTNPSYNPQARRNTSHQFANHLRVYSYPTVLFFDENAQQISRVRGYRNVQQMEVYLKLFAKNKHVSEAKKSAYIKNFKFEFGK